MTTSEKRAQGPAELGIDLGIDLATELVRVTEAAAIAASQLTGRGDKNAADGLAVQAMRAALARVPLDGTVVIGEGEKDAAPMLYLNERVGDGTGPQVDVAVDPIDGTTLCAKGMPNALSVLAVAPRHSMADLSSAYYMEKLMAGPAGRDVLDLTAPIEHNLAALAAATSRTVSELTVGVLDRPRHAELLNSIRRAGARVNLFSDGDVAAAIVAAREGSPLDLVAGIGGAPEAVITACAMSCLGGVILGRLRPQSEEEDRRIREAGLNPDMIWTTSDFVTSEQVHMVATGITDGDLLHGVRTTATAITTTSLALSRTQQRLLHTNHQLQAREPAA